jgi:hypothetical protein
VLSRVLSVQAPPVPPAPPAPPATPRVFTTEQPTAGDEVPAPGERTVTRDGKTYTVQDNGSYTATSGGTSVSVNGIPDIPPQLYSLAQGGIIGLTLVLIAFPVFGFLKALVNRRAMTPQALPTGDLTARLQRIESAVDAMAVEVERITEGQRFVTKVLSERSSSQS